MSRDSSSSNKLWSRGSQSTGKRTDEPTDQQETKDRSQAEEAAAYAKELTTARYPRHSGTVFPKKTAGSSSRSHGFTSKISNVLRKGQTKDGSVRLKDDETESQGSGTADQAAFQGASVSHVVSGGITATVTVQSLDEQADQEGRAKVHTTKPKTWDQSSSECDIGPEVVQKEFW